MVFAQYHVWKMRPPNKGLGVFGTHIYTCLIRFSHHFPCGFPPRGAMKHQNMVGLFLTNIILLCKRLVTLVSKSPNGQCGEPNNKLSPNHNFCVWFFNHSQVVGLCHVPISTWWFPKMWVLTNQPTLAGFCTINQPF